MRPIPLPPESPRCPIFQVFADGQPVDVLTVGIASIARIEMDGPVHIEVRAAAPIARGEIRPRRLGIPLDIANGRAAFTLEKPANVWIDLAGDRAAPALYLFAFAPEQDAPGPDDPNTLYFPAGQVHDAGTIELRPGQTLYIAGGAVVRAMVRASGVADITLRGRGILDGTLLPGMTPSQWPRRRTINFQACRNISVRDITMVHPTSWMLCLVDCEKVNIHNLHEVGEIVSSDGIDIVGSRRVTIDGCFLRNNDDCIAIKAIAFRPDQPDLTVDGAKDVEDVLVQNCTFWNDGAGNVMEIGFESQTAKIRSIIFRNIDVLASHGHGAVFSIHVGDRATVSDVLWEDIHVEHFWDFLLDFRIFKSRYSKDPDRGHIRGITLRRITTIADIFNIPSLIGGHDAEHLADNIHIEQFAIGDRDILSADDLHLFTNQHCRGIEFN